MSGVLRFVLGLSLAGGATCLVVFAAGLPFRKLVKKSWLFYLWLVVLLRFIVPVPLNLPFVSDGFNSIVSYISSAEPAPTSVSAHTVSAPDSDPASNGAALTAQEVLSNNSDADGDEVLSSANNSANVENNPVRPAEFASTLPAAGDSGVAPAAAMLLTVLPYVWLIGAFVMLIWTVTGYALTVSKLRRGRTLLTPGRVPVFESDRISTPILAGIIHPAIYLPVGFPEKELAIRHERTHLRRGDIWLKWLVQLTVCVHWFNPLAWLMKRELNRLTELACDSAVIRRLNPTERTGYGQMLLNTAHAVTDRSGVLIASLGKDKCFLAERIIEIVRTRKTTRRAVTAMSVLAVIIIASAIVFGALFTGCTANSETASPQASPGTSDTDTTPETISTYTIPTGTAPGFVNDPYLVGTWLPSAFTNSVSDFSPGGSNGNFSGYALVAYENGWTNEPYMTWSKDVFNYYNNQLSAEYTIRDIDGSRYLFVKALAENQYFSGESYDYAVYEWNSEPIQTTYYTDDIDLPFVDDPVVLGTWKTVSAVQKISDFDPGKLNESDTEITFLKGGEIKNPSLGALVKTGFSWTKGFLINSYNITASAYEIKEIDGITYMFIEGKNNGYYTHKHEIQAYSVWQRVTETVPSPSPSASVTETALTYTIPSDPPPGFVTDPDVIGTWTAYTLIKSISDFAPVGPTERIHFTAYPFIIYENGRVNMPNMTWSKGFFNDFGGQLNYEYVVREIDGSKYLFIKLPLDTPYKGETYRYEVFAWLSKPFNKTIYIDNIDLPFTNDPALIGTWRLDNAVIKIDDFYPGKPATVNTNNTMSIFEGGASVRSFPSITISGFSWTKGVLLDPYALTADAYQIKEIDGAAYMFVEYKEDGTYWSRHTVPGYLVWKKIS